jgi:DNA-directed RNA polymerase specialized sigma24 family protein
VTEISRVLSRPRSAVKEQASRGASQPDLTALYDAYARALYRYLVALLGAPAEAEDALQEVLLGLLRRRAGGIRNQRAYLFQAARRQALQALRQRRSGSERRPRPPSAGLTPRPAGAGTGSWRWMCSGHWDGSP